MPVIKVQNKVAELEKGTVLEAHCTDPGVLNDIPAWCRINGHRVIETRTDAEVYVVILEVGETE